jgi:hypothetical protein
MSSKYFKIEELVQPEVLAEYGESECWGMIPPHVCDALDAIREAHGHPITVNAGVNQHCGIRATNCTVGAPHSDHKITNPNEARAFDLHSPELAALKILVKGRSQEFKVFRIECDDATPTWLHCSFYQDPEKAVGSLVIFNP